MNYIKEINAFYDMVERNPLSMSAITLWHALMHINNKAHWCDTFTAAAAVLQHKAGLTDSSFKRARKELNEKGYITHKAGSQSQAPTYRIIRLTRSENETNTHPETITHMAKSPIKNTDTVPNTDSNTNMNANANVNTNPNLNPNMNPNTDPNADANTNRHPAPLLKQNKKNTKPNKTINNQQQADAIRFYQNNFGVASPFVIESILDWSKDMPEELIIHAMERALEQGKANWGYVKGILTNWEKKGIRTLQVAINDAVEFRKKQDPKHTHQEIIPDWFKDLEQRKQPKSKNIIHHPEEQAAIIAETQTMIRDISTPLRT